MVKTTQIPTCTRHGEATRLSCAECGTPVCPRCMTRTEVGLRCDDCASPAVPAPTRRSRRRLSIALILVGVLAVLLPIVLLAGGDGGTATADRAAPAPPTGSWTSLGELQANRGTAVAVALEDGRVLVAGGGVGAIPIAGATLLDPADGTSRPAGELAQARRGHRAQLLDDGRVLIAGGFADGQVLATSELFDPATGAWQPAADMGIPRLGHTLTLLADGRVLAVGGDTPGATDGGTGSQSIRPTSRGELYDPATDRWEPIPDMSSPRFEHTATLLSDGRVLVTGGMGSSDGRLEPLGTAELFDPATGAWTHAGTLRAARANHAAAPLADGRVLIVGGVGGRNGDVSLESAEVFDPRRGAWTDVASLDQPRTGLTATTLTDGRVLVAGGELVSQGTRRSLASTEVYEPHTDGWRSGGDMDCPRSEHAAVRLPDGRVAVIAGDAAFPGEAPVAASCVDLYTP